MSHCPALLASVGLLTVGLLTARSTRERVVQLEYSPSVLATALLWCVGVRVWLRCRSSCPRLSPQVPSRPVAHPRHARGSARALDFASPLSLLWKADSESHGPVPPSALQRGTSLQSTAQHATRHARRNMKCCVRHATVYRPPRLGSIDCADAAASVAHSPRFIADPKSSIGTQCSAACRCFTAALRCSPARQSLCVVRLCNCHAASHAARCVAYCVARLHSILQLCNVQRVACHGLCAASHGASIGHLAYSGIASRGAARAVLTKPSAAVGDQHWCIHSFTAGATSFPQLRREFATELRRDLLARRGILTSRDGGSAYAFVHCWI